MWCGACVLFPPSVVGRAEETEFFLELPDGSVYRVRVPGIHERVDTEWWAIRQIRETGEYVQKQIAIRGMGVFELEVVREARCAQLKRT